MKYEASAASFCCLNWQGALALTWDRLHYLTSGEDIHV